MFDPATVTEFRFVSRGFDEATGIASFTYAFDTGETFVETFRFPTPGAPLDEPRRNALDRALFLLSLVAGVSYYKAAVPPTAVIESGPVTEQEAAYLKSIFSHGLGEFAFVNQLDLRSGPVFEYQPAEPANPAPLALERRSLVAVGGGKDSCVSIETLRRTGEPMMLASIKQAKPIVDVMAVAGLTSVHVDRTISPTLLDLNDNGAYNGHVPITAVVSLALIATAIITNCDAVVLSNERSASVGNVEHLGTMVNHQYSKSLEAEAALADVVHTSIAPNLEYFSLLRPLSELDIAKRFADMTKYHHVFTSCNRAFRIDPDRRIDHWCGDCPKCRFVFLILAPFLDHETMHTIFGFDLLDDIGQVGGVSELIGWNAHKPFECVGEVEESVAALLLLAQNSNWKNHAVVKHFCDEILPLLGLDDSARAALVAQPFIPSDSHRVPPRYLQVLSASG